MWLMYAFCDALRMLMVSLHVVEHECFNIEKICSLDIRYLHLETSVSILILFYSYNITALFCVFVITLFAYHIDLNIVLK